MSKTISTFTVQSPSPSSKISKKNFQLSDFTKDDSRLTNKNFGVVELMVLMTCDAVMKAKLAYLDSLSSQTLNTETQRIILESENQEYADLPLIENDLLQQLEHKLTVFSQSLWRYQFMHKLRKQFPNLPTNRGNSIDWKSHSFKQLKAGLLEIFANQTEYISFKHFQKQPQDEPLTALKPSLHDFAIKKSQSSVNMYQRIESKTQILDPARKSIIQMTQEYLESGDKQHLLHSYSTPSLSTLLNGRETMTSFDKNQRWVVSPIVSPEEEEMFSPPYHKQFQLDDLVQDFDSLKLPKSQSHILQRNQLLNFNTKLKE